ncbi:phosphoadenosine phosphosulfate reductase family protein [Curvibacter sp. APW13]|uniref:phosphoadenosine phosphosulfate reductase family protein n=1 Tax=Curvibacter sp. APW13 TaxID=3077236 RepID=UPI0028DD5DF8|nr:phosphoadenosine phosphosulfate reductase family protein [Curvibacter sp. APW13]MDT8992815.1 phosphoadenosine phosphosulfate reductase family protein [Curvibacter sp. APW13]
MSAVTATIPERQARRVFQLDLFNADSVESPAPVTLTLAQLLTYDIIYVGFSGGKDSLACVLHLLELGVPRERIELHHHLVDGRESEQMMDFPVTEAYCRAVAAYLGIPIYMSWKVGGFEGEMTRLNQPTGPTRFETPDGEVVQTGGESNKVGTRRKFPQTSASLQSRWCSSYLKISVCAATINGQDRFLNKRTLVVTGERAQESSSRAKYANFEPHRTDARAGRLKRQVDHYRPVHAWTEQEVWAIIERFAIRPHPAYAAGYGRLSCALCIFGNRNQWATGRHILPRQFEKVRAYEAEFGVTIHRKHDVLTLANEGTPYSTATPSLIDLLRIANYDLPVRMSPWELPAGAYGDSNGSP